MNIFDSILSSVKSWASSFNENIIQWGLGTKAYDWVNPEQNTIQRFLDDPKIDKQKKDALFADLQAGKPSGAIEQYVKQKYYPEATFQETVPTVQPFFPATWKENQFTATAKMAWNLPSSLWNLWAWAINIWSTAISEWVLPTAELLAKWTVKGIWQGAEAISEWYQQWGVWQAFNVWAEWLNKYLINNPADILAPKIIPKAIKVGGKAVKTGVQATGKTLSKVPKVLWEWTSAIWETAISQASGLERWTIQNIIKSPELFKKARLWEITRETELATASSAIEKRLSDLSELWKWYESVRKSPVIIPKSEVSGIVSRSLDDLWFEKLPDGNPSLIDLPVQDRKAIEQALKYVNEYWDNLSAKNALSLRQKLDSLVDWKSDASPAGERVVQAIRSNLDSYIWEKIPWLKALDAQYWPEKNFLKQVRKSIYNKDGTLKDNALSTIGNITGKGKENMLARLEDITPWIWKRIEALKAFEDIQRSSGIKVGTYARNAGTIALGTVNPIIAIWSWIATHPVVVSRVLEAYWVAKSQINKILSSKKISKLDAEIVKKAVENTDTSKVESIISNLSFNPKTQKLTSKTLQKSDSKVLVKKSATVVKKPLSTSSTKQKEWAVVPAKAKPLAKSKKDNSMSEWLTFDEFINTKKQEYKDRLKKISPWQSEVWYTNQTNKQPKFNDYKFMNKYKEEYKILSTPKKLTPVKKLKN